MVKSAAASVGSREFAVRAPHRRCASMREERRQQSRTSAIQCVRGFHPGDRRGALLATPLFSCSITAVKPVTKLFEPRWRPSNCRRPYHHPCRPCRSVRHRRGGARPLAGFPLLLARLALRAAGQLPPPPPPPPPAPRPAPPPPPPPGTHGVLPWTAIPPPTSRSTDYPTHPSHPPRHEARGG
eukprot:scaffold78085_cov45-Phaeocystis_antarctica.AAC.1